MVGGGGAGFAVNNSHTGGPGGGSGEFCLNVPYHVTASGTVTVTIGAKGTGVAGNVNSGVGSAGGTTSFGTLSVKGGGAAASSTRGAGGGANGAAAGGCSNPAV